MQALEFSKRRIEAFLSQIRQLKRNEFPYDHVLDALAAVETRFQDHLAELNSVTSANDVHVVNQLCSATVAELDGFLPLLGFFARSVDVRNAFEVYAPLLRMARAFLGTDVKLVLSSEWNFSPYTFQYGAFPSLQQFVMIGLPAPESANALLLPLAGHELGHSVWRHLNLSIALANGVQTRTGQQLLDRWPEWQKAHPGAQITSGTPDLFTLQSLGRAQHWALGQLQESFCDYFGLALFGKSYLLAFAYLLAPGGFARSYIYPPLSRRVKSLEQVALARNIDVPAGFSDWFVDDTKSPKSGTEDQFLLSLADDASMQADPEVSAAVASAIATAGVTLPDDSEQARIARQLRMLVPASGTRSLADTLNAGWEISGDAKFCPAGDPLHLNREFLLIELLLKTIEVFEIETRLR